MIQRPNGILTIIGCDSITVVNENTFEGPNEGEDYEPLTLIRSSPMNDDLTKVKADLDYHVSVLQQIYDKLDTISDGATGEQTAEQIVTKINSSSQIINAANLDTTVVLATELTAAISSHLAASTYATRHALTNINGTTSVYYYTPTTIATASQRTLEDEINNIRYQIKKITGKSTWITSPTMTIESIASSLGSTESGNFQKNLTNRNSNYTIDRDTVYCVIVNASAADITITLPSMDSFEDDGRMFVIKKVDSSTYAVIIAVGASGNYIDGDSSYYLYSQNESITVICDYDARTWRII